MAKAESITLDEARALVGDAALWPRMREFLWDFAPQVHESWVESLKVESSEYGLESSTLSSPRVRRFILDKLGVEPFFHDFPKDDWSRLALLDGATLLGIVKWIGALACAEELRRVTDGASVRELKSALTGIYPEVFGYTAYFRSLKVEGSKVESFNTEKLNPQCVVAAGVQCLYAFVANLPQPLLKRLSLKLPSNLKPSTLNLQPSTLNLRLLLKLRFPEAYSLCCS